MLNTLLAANTPIFPKEIQDRLEVHERIYADSVKALEEEISDNTTPLLRNNPVQAINSCLFRTF